MLRKKPAKKVSPRAKRYRRDLSTIGVPQISFCVSAPRELIAELDRAAEARCMARSHAIREAVARWAREVLR